jgi:site-specific DNA-methyltransferase (adenine-specific)/adenine-specific DNA-methyltransferase
MPTLDWIGKKAVVNHHQEVPYHLLRDVPALGCGPADSGNLIVEGDNLTALKALLPYYAGQVKCIYIDPPYNTGNEGWVYNDNVNSPEINAWLGKVVGKEAEDLSRHDKWLCMMYPRLKLLREFLREDGAIFVNLDDNEAATCRLVLEEIFGRSNFIATIAWQRRISPDARLKLGQAHDHVIVFARRAESVSLHKVPLSGAQIAGYKNPDEDPKGEWVSTDFTAQGWRPNQMYPIITPGGVTYEPPHGRCWGNIESEYLKLKNDGRMWFGKDGKGRPRVKTYLRENEGVSSWSWWPHEETGHNQEAKKEINAVLENESPFDTPKPTRLVERVFQIASLPGDLVMDSFAGSGTTAHAVLKLNSAQPKQTPRRFIVSEIDPKIAQAITAERLRRVASGFTNTKGEKIAGLGGGFRYVQLGEQLFDAAGKIRSTVRFRDLARHVFFTETGTPLPHDAPCDKPLLGVAHGTGVYLLYNGILKDKSPDGGNVLTQAILDRLPPHDGPKVIYAVSSRVSPQRLKSLGITFKQTPYAIKVR